MNLQSARAQKNRIWKYGVLLGIVLLAVLPLAVLGSRLDNASQSLADEPSPVMVGETATANGVSLTLTSVSASVLGADASFSVTLPPAVAKSSAPDILAPMFLGKQLRVTGFASSPGRTTLEAESHRPGDVTLQFTLALGPVVDPSQAATITFNQLSFLISEDQPPTDIAGPWIFNLAPSVIESDAPISSRDIDLVSQQDGVTVAVNHVESRPSGLYVYYSVEAQTNEPITAVFPSPRLVFNDGSIARASTVGSIDPGNSAEQSTVGKFVAVFHPVKTPGASAQLQFGPYVTSNGLSASVAIQNPTGVWSATPITIGGEQLIVSQVEYNAQNERLVITVQNNEPVKTAAVLFLGVDTARSITAVDENGHQYQYLSASTGMRRQNDTVLGAGESTFTFEGVSESVQRFTVTVDHSSVLLRGPWSASIQLP